MMGCLYEGWAADWQDARARLSSGEITMASGLDYGVGVPLAGVVSPSMFLVEIDARLPGSDPRYAPLLEGFTHSGCMGVRDDGYVVHRRWIDCAVAGWIEQALAERPVGLADILSQALERGDDAHSRCGQGSELLVESLERRRESPGTDVARFLRGPLTALPVWMAMASSVLSHYEAGTSPGIITSLASNGVELGVRVSGISGWRTTAAPRLRPVGSIATGAPMPAIGDSAVVDAMGLGGQLTSERNVVDPAGCLQPRVNGLLKESGIALLGGRSAIIDLERASSAPVRMLMGILDANGQAGRLGAGVADLPRALMARVRAEVEQLGVETSGVRV